MRFNTLSIKKSNDLIFGYSPKPVTTRRGLIIGGGIVYPELNFTLPTMSINDSTLTNITNQYKEIVNGALERALQLEAPGLIFEFETLLEMTQNPQIAIGLVKVMNDVCEEYYVKHGLKSEIRLTPNDLREFERPPKQRTSELLDLMIEVFEGGLNAGGDLLSIESTGGKEVSDDALMNCNIKQLIFALSVLGVRDMKMLWRKMVDICLKKGKIPAGDTACGFGNTAMVLAEKKYIPKVFAAVVRIVTVVRTLVCIEEGAVGPDKDCGYEGVYLKAITGIPISMEGKTSACAHLSPVGNIAGACADLWSNESVQNIKLLSGMAPTAYYEQLEYDTRLMNEAIKEGSASILNLQRLMVNSDIYHDPQALVLAPDVVIQVAGEIVKGKNYIDASIRGALKGLDIIEEAVNSDKLKLEDREVIWIDSLRSEIETIPTDESKFVEETIAEIGTTKFIPAEYGL
ncbi:MAG: methyltransferase MtaB domain-containing protein [Ignavibacteriaceae bacterium]|nr:methyltransferase MtaB domain-containing protein [Ignavibacteriaceae bacterium]